METNMILAKPRTSYSEINKGGLYYGLPTTIGAEVIDCHLLRSVS